MPNTKITFDSVRDIALAIPGVQEGTATLAIRMDFNERDELIAAEPRTYYLTNHYVDYPCVLVRLARVRQDALRDLLLMGWRFISTTKNPNVQKRKRTRARWKPQ